MYAILSTHRNLLVDSIREVGRKPTKGLLHITVHWK